jgi:hypothetical protein
MKIMSEDIRIELIETKKTVSDAIARFERSYDEIGKKQDRTDGKLDMILTEMSRHSTRIALNENNINTNKKDLCGVAERSNERIDDMNITLKELIDKQNKIVIKVGGVLTVVSIIIGLIIKFAG